MIALRTWIALSALMTILLVFSDAKAASSLSYLEACQSLAECAQAAGALTGQKYVFDADAKGAALATSNLQLAPENAEVLFTHALAMNGYTRLPIVGAGDGTFQIIKQRDARDSALPVYEASLPEAPTLPRNWDLATLRYQAAHPENVKKMAEHLRNFIPANSRAVADELSGSVWVTDSHPNLNKAYGMLKALDVKARPEVLRKWEDWDRARREAAAKAMQ